jgi:hypothetical protein
MSPSCFVYGILIDSLDQKGKFKCADSTSTKTTETEKISRKGDRDRYHMERWLNETGKEEAWSVYIRK